MTIQTTFKQHSNIKKKKKIKKHSLPDHAANAAEADLPLAQIASICSPRNNFYPSQVSWSSRNSGEGSPRSPDLMSGDLGQNDDVGSRCSETGGDGHDGDADREADCETDQDDDEQQHLLNSGNSTHAHTRMKSTGTVRSTGTTSIPMSMAKSLDHQAAMESNMESIRLGSSVFEFNENGSAAFAENSGSQNHSYPEENSDSYPRKQFGSEQEEAAEDADRLSDDESSERVGLLKCHTNELDYDTEREYDQGDYDDNPDHNRDGSQFDTEYSDDHSKLKVAVKVKIQMLGIIISSSLINED
jgi:hypothetical protein